jgi:hypothetical protein
MYMCDRNLSECNFCQQGWWVDEWVSEWVNGGNKLHKIIFHFNSSQREIEDGSVEYTTGAIFVIFGFNLILNI